MPRFLLAVLVASLAAPASNAQAAPPVSLEIITEPGLALGSQSQWLATLKKLDWAGIQFRGARGDDRVKVEQRGSDRSPSYHVVGLLKADDRLLLPGARPFKNTDRAAISDWLKKLREGGEQGLTQRQGALGMTSQQLVAVHEKLATPIRFDTKGKPAGDVVSRIAETLMVELQVPPSAKELLASEETVRDELRGLSGGTALAAALRPLGLVVYPRAAAAGDLQLVIADARQASHSWPVGWPSQKSTRQLMPQLFKFLPVEIQDFTLEDALAAVGKRLEAPMLFDHNSMARHQIDPSKVKVSIPKSTTYYKRIIDRLLFQAKLKGEIRVDEAGEPFLWVSTIKQ